MERRNRYTYHICQVIFSTSIFPRRSLVVSTIMHQLSSADISFLSTISIRLNVAISPARYRGICEVEEKTPLHPSSFHYSLYTARIREARNVFLEYDIACTEPLKGILAFVKIERGVQDFLVDYFVRPILYGRATLIKLDLVDRIDSRPRVCSRTIQVEFYLRSKLGCNKIIMSQKHLKEHNN